MTLRFLSFSSLIVLLTASILPIRAIAGSNQTPVLSPQEQQILREFDQFRRTASPTELETTPTPGDIVAFQAQLKQMKQTVMLYTMVTDQEVNLILVTPDRIIARKVAVSRQELNRAILEFRNALQAPNSDAKSPGQKLYGWLIQPIEKELSEAKAQTILYSPNSTLRYVPLAALYDGKQWLVERYGVNNIIGATLTKFDAQRQPLRVLAAASTGEATVRIGDRTERFPPLIYTKSEVEAIANLVPNTTVLLDQAFSREALLAQMGSHNVVHLATNAKFSPNTPEDSLILLGNGDRVMFKDLQNWNLTNVDLLVLSSCDTAIGGVRGDGTEILSFAYMAQRAGAKAVLGSLWAVDDRGTQILMSQFYGSLAQGATKTDSLRQAQLAMIQSDRTKGIGTAEDPQTKKRLSHPFYWAAFVLTGNGL